MFNDFNENSLARSRLQIKNPNHNSQLFYPSFSVENNYAFKQKQFDNYINPSNIRGFYDPKNSWPHQRVQSSASYVPAYKMTTNSYPSRTYSNRQDPYKQDSYKQDPYKIYHSIQSANNDFDKIIRKIQIENFKTLTTFDSTSKQPEETKPFQMMEPSNYQYPNLGSRYNRNYNLPLDMYAKSNNMQLNMYAKSNNLPLDMYAKSNNMNNQGFVKAYYSNGNDIRQYKNHYDNSKSSSNEDMAKFKGYLNEQKGSVRTNPSLTLNSGDINPNYGFSHEIKHPKGYQKSYFVRTEAKENPPSTTSSEMPIKNQEKDEFSELDNFETKINGKSSSRWFPFDDSSHRDSWFDNKFYKDFVTDPNVKFPKYDLNKNNNDRDYDFSKNNKPIYKFVSPESEIQTNDSHSYQQSPNRSAYNSSSNEPYPMSKFFTVGTTLKF